MINYLRSKESNAIVLRMFPVIMLSNALAIVLLLLRLERTSSLSFMFLLWNLFLAWIPFAVSLAFRRNMQLSRWGRAGLFVLWLLFFPNAPYIVTDLIHLKQRTGVPLWYDLMLILAFAWCGLMLGFASLHNVHLIINEKLGRVKAWIIVFCLLVLCSFGIYLGRFLRWNSWDMVTNPLKVLEDSFVIIIDPLSNIQPIGFTLIFSLFLVISYLTLLILVRPDEKGTG